MTPKLLRNAYYVILALLITGCSSLDPLLSTPTPVAVTEAASTPQADPTPTLTTNQPRLLRVWLPPRFDPNAETPAAGLLKQRLLDFESEYPGIRLEIRIKSEVDILDALAVTNNAAPDAMPDLIALSYADMQAVAAAGFLHPLEGLTSVLQNPDWYGFARELGHYQNTEYGIPFACDVLLVVHRSAFFSEKPAGWDAVFESNARMVFPVSGPAAHFPLSLYLSENKPLLDDQGTVTLDEGALVRLFSFFARGIETGAAPPFTRDYQMDSQALQFFRGGGADLAVVRASSDVLSPSGEYLPLWGLDNDPYTIGDGWVWALAGSSAENQPLAVELASYLVESGFMSGWTRAQGVLPTRPQALDDWEEEGLKTSLTEVLRSAHPLPPQDVTSVVAPILQEALIRVFNGEQPDVVARSVIEDLK
jgi:ABC-type glycerol-3-phosphate transport system substrate-binding protein